MENEDRLFKLFDQARKLSGAERERFLRNCCGDDPDMEEQVVSLVQAAESAGDFLGGTLVPPNLLLTEKPGDRIGCYRLGALLGEGGCGQSNRSTARAPNDDCRSSPPPPSSGQGSARGGSDPPQAVVAVSRYPDQH